MPAACIAGRACHLKHFLNQQQQERLKLLPNSQPSERQSACCWDDVVGFHEDHKASSPSNNSLLAPTCLLGVNTSENPRNIILLVILNILFLTAILFIPASANNDFAHSVSSAQENPTAPLLGSSCSKSLPYCADFWTSCLWDPEISEWLKSDLPGFTDCFYPVARKVDSSALLSMLTPCFEAVTNPKASLWWDFNLSRNILHGAVTWLVKEVSRHYRNGPKGRALNSCSMRQRSTKAGWRWPTDSWILKDKELKWLLLKRAVSHDFHGNCLNREGNAWYGNQKRALSQSRMSSVNSLHFLAVGLNVCLPSFAPLFPFWSTSLAKLCTMKAGPYLI